MKKYAPPAQRYYRTKGQRHYEITNHLGNVMATLSDRKLGQSPNNDTLINYYHADLLSAQDYYPGGMLMPGRSYSSKSYRFGFGSYEKDDEVKGVGNWYAFGDYGYDARIVQRPSPDPLKGRFPHISPYAAFNNNPIIFTDPDGKENIVVIGGADKGQQDRYKFINSGLGQAFSYSGAEKTTIVLVTANMTAEEIIQVQQYVAAGNNNVYQGRQVVNLVTVESADEVANYFNSQSTTEDNVSQARLDDKVTDVAIFGHGISGSMEFGYDYISGPKSADEQKMSFGTEQINQLNPQAFDNANINLYTCNSATNSNGTNVAKDMSKQTNSTVSGYRGQSSYSGIYNIIDRVLKKMGYEMLPASNKPGTGQGAEKKTYTNGKEQ